MAVGVRFGFLVFVIALFITQAATAKTIAVCGASSGMSYNIQGGLIQPGKSGWEKDGISNGLVMLIQDGKVFDIISQDATGGTRSAKADGALVMPIGGLKFKKGELTVLVVVIYKGATSEHYLFRSHGTKGELLWGQLKMNALVSKGFLFRSECQFY
ncbi:MAG: hypothetical protein JKY17_06585 [Magnetovibrio sp.]|nr:hypothetical protein [Magnetovibrio sp.]